MAHCGGRDEVVRAEQPAFVLSLIEPVLAREAEGEVKAGLQAAAVVLAEVVAHVGQEARHVEVLLVGVVHTYVAHHHKEARGILQCLVPALLLRAFARADGELEPRGILREHDDFIIVYHLVADGIARAVGAQGGDAELLALLVVLDGERGVGLELYFLRKVLLLGLLLGGGCRSGELLVGFLQEGHVVVERFEVEAGVVGGAARVGDVVAHGGAVFEVGAARPVVRAVVGKVGGEPVEERQFVERQFPGEIKGLLIRQGASHVLDAVPNGIFPCRVAVGKEILVHSRIGLLDFSVCAGRERGVDALRQVPAQLERAVPKEVARPRERYRRVVEIFHIALLKLVVSAVDVGVESDVLRNIVEILFLDDFEPRAFALQFLKGFVRLIVRRVAVAKVPFPVFIFLPRRSLARGVACAMGVAKRKVGGVVGHGVALRGDVEACAGDAEVLVDDHSLGNVFQ